jgi:hypothetical protein
MIKTLTMLASSVAREAVPHLVAVGEVMVSSQSNKPFSKAMLIKLILW